MMCNEHKKEKNTEIHEDIRFIDYRLTQLEANLKQGQEKLEKEQNSNYHELIQILQSIQEANTVQNQKLIELAEKTRTIETQVHCIDRLRDVATRHTTEIHELERRLEIYKQVLFVVGTGVALALVTELINIL